MLGCAIALLFGYAPWPGSWQSHLPRQFAETIRDTGQYAQEALVTSPAAGTEAGQPAEPGGESLLKRSQLRRRAYRALSDLRTEFERAMSEPPAVSRNATAWWPALVGLEGVLDAVTSTAVAVSHGAAAASPDAVRQVTGALEAVADAVQAGRTPPAVELPSDEPLHRVTDAVRSVLSVIASPQQRARQS